MKSHLRRLGLTGAAVGVTAVVVVFGLPSQNEVRTRTVEQELKRETARQRQSLSHIECEREDGLPRSFSCFGEGADDQHLAYRVAVLPNGSLDIRPP